MKTTYYSGKWYLTIVKNEGEETYCYFDLIKCINSKWGCPASRVGSIEHVLEVIKGYKEIDEKPEFENSRELNTDNFKMYEDFTEILNKALEDEKNKQNKNIKSLNNDELFTTYQKVRQQLLNAEIETVKEMELDTLFTELSKEIEIRDIDLKSYKLAEKEVVDMKNVENNEILCASKRNFIKELYHNFTIFRVENKNMILKCLLLSCVIAIGCLVNGFNANAVTTQSSQDKTIIDYYTMQDGSVKTVYNDNSFVVNSDVTIQNMNWIDNTVAFNKDGQLYSFYANNARDYYLGEKINVTMDNDNKVIDCTVDSEPVIYKNVSVIDSNHDEYVYVNINGNKYSFYNEDGINNGWNIGDKCNVIMQNGKILEVRPYMG